MMTTPRHNMDAFVMHRPPGLAAGCWQPRAMPTGKAGLGSTHRRGMRDAPARPLLSPWPHAADMAKFCVANNVDGTFNVLQAALQARALGAASAPLRPKQLSEAGSRLGAGPQLPCGRDALEAFVFCHLPWSPVSGLAACLACNITSQPATLVGQRQCGNSPLLFPPPFPPFPPAGGRHPQGGLRCQQHGLREQPCATERAAAAGPADTLCQ